MKSLSSNLLKRGFAYIQQDSMRVINTNELLEQRIKELSVRPQPVREEEAVPEEGFREGLEAVGIDALLSDGESSNVIKAEDTGAVLEEAKQEAAEILAQAKEQAEQIVEQGKAQTQQERQEVLEQARSAGYEEGQRKAREENAKQQKAFKQQTEALEEEYRKRVAQLEPDLVEAITGIYEHIFAVDLAEKQDILVHLITATLQKAESGRDFIVHVSKEDYPYVSQQKKEILENAVGSGTLEVISDISLNKNECMIETDGGIFDCGLGTQLSELRKKLLLLSYENSDVH